LEKPLKTKAFTLIELLIVVAIIAILAAIAVPNFLEAQTRAKVSRAKNDMRTLATAIESYQVDNNNYPTDAGNGIENMNRPYPPLNNNTNHPNPNYSIGFELTTPIAYISSMAPLIDVFKLQKAVDLPDLLWGRKFYNFNSAQTRFKAGGYGTLPGGMGQASYNVYTEHFGAWCLMGAGPDTFVCNGPGQQDFQNPLNRAYLGTNYDATNGTVSNGDIYRSHKFTDGAKERP
jgi:prepilin-type N-terminal cleavage/methylation domain-containing protein